MKKLQTGQQRHSCIYWVFIIALLYDCLQSFGSFTCSAVVSSASDTICVYCAFSNPAVDEAAVWSTILSLRHKLKLKLQTTGTWAPAFPVNMNRAETKWSGQRKRRRADKTEMWYGARDGENSCNVAERCPSGCSESHRGSCCESVFSIASFPRAVDAEASVSEGVTAGIVNMIMIHLHGLMITPAACVCVCMDAYRWICTCIFQGDNDRDAVFFQAAHRDFTVTEKSFLPLLSWKSDKIWLALPPGRREEIC